jgi:hypothetical protein
MEGLWASISLVLARMVSTEHQPISPDALWKAFDTSING